MATIKFSKSLTESDPQTHPVLIVGQTKFLNSISYDDVKIKLQPRVNAATFSLAVSNLHPAPTDSCSLWMNNATVAALSAKCSRHNTSTRAHSLCKVVKSCLTGGDEFIVIVCDHNDIVALASAIARCLPLYSMKSTSNSTKHVVTIEFVLAGSNTTISNEDIACLDAIASSVRLAAKIVDMPCDTMHTDAFIKEASDIAAALNIEPVIVQGEELDRQGFGGIWGVGKAAIHQPALVVLSHKPAGATKNIAWVGKGIVFDTGGLCIKAKASMCGMKRDCGGAAAILGAFYTAVKMGFTENLHAVFCLAENAIGNAAYRPDDILTLYSGRTVEINNTDAEGRVVLGDGVSYAQKDLEADIIVDMATLTGAQGIATGKYHASILTNNEQIEGLCVKAGQSCGDLVHPMPFTPELHFNEFSSALADMKNSVADRSNAQVSCAGLFIFSHIGFDYPGTWLHIDIAAPAHLGERATGYGVTLLNTLFGKFSSNKLLQETSPGKIGDASDKHDNAKKMRMV